MYYRHCMSMSKPEALFQPRYNFHGLDTWSKKTFLLDEFLEIGRCFACFGFYVVRLC